MLLLSRCDAARTRARAQAENPSCSSSTRLPVTDRLSRSAGSCVGASSEQRYATAALRCFSYRSESGSPASCWGSSRSEPRLLPGEQPAATRRQDTSLRFLTPAQTKLQFLHPNIRSNSSANKSLRVSPLSAGKICVWAGPPSSEAWWRSPSSLRAEEHLPQLCGRRFTAPR